MIDRRTLLGLAATAPWATLPRRGRSSELGLVVGDQKGGSRALMEAAGVLDGVPYEVKWREFPAAAPLLEALNAGAIDTGVAGDAPVIFAQAAGVPLKAIGAWRWDPTGTAVVVMENSAIRTPADLRGRRIATGKGSIGHWLALAVLDEAGIPVDEVTLSFLLPSDAKAALASGSVDAWSTWDPYTSQLLLLERARTVATGRGRSAGLSFQVASEAAIDGKRHQLADFLARLAKARVWSLDHVDAYAAAMSRIIGIPQPVAHAWLAGQRAQFVNVDEGVLSDQQRTIDLYARHGVIRERVLAADALDGSFNAAVAAYVVRS